MAGRLNLIADALYLFHFQRFHLLAPRAAPTARPIPRSLGPASTSIIQKCLFYLVHVLASLTRRVYSSAQKQFIEFFLHEILWIGKATLSRPRSKSFCVFFPTWWTAFTTPLLKFIFLEFVDSTETWVSGILWSTAYDSRDTCLELSLIKAPAVVHASLSQGTWWKVAIAPWISMTMDTLFQVARCLAFFFFLRAREFIVDSPFDPSIHLTLQDLQLDSVSNPSCLKYESTFKPLKHTLLGRLFWLPRSWSHFQLSDNLHQRIPSSACLSTVSPLHIRQRSATDTSRTVKHYTV